MTTSHINDKDDYNSHTNGDKDDYNGYNDYKD
jgi:hypothetical protein